MKLFIFQLLTQLSSRKSISWITGALAKSSISKKLIPTFAKTYRIRIEDAEKPLLAYATLNEFFTRRLKPGLRPLDSDVEQAVSPVDGVITGIGAIEQGLMIGIKGQTYTLQELLHNSHRTAHFEYGSYIVIYLSPTDYHRIHAPVTGTIREKEHIHGKVYPVNEFGLTRMKRVLSRNERLVTYIGHEAGEVAVVKVGAMNVSSIKYTSNLSSTIKRGDELAYFEFGSTVVLLFESGTFSPRHELKLGTKLLMGQRLGKIHAKS